MPPRHRLVGSIGLALLTLTGCAAITDKPELDTVKNLVSTRSPGREIVWAQGRAEDEAVSLRVRQILARELTLDAAIQVALLNNRALQAVYAELGIAQADLVQAGLLQNPILSADVRFPTADAAIGAGLGLVQELIAAVKIPLKKRVAAAELDEAVLTVGAAVIDLIVDVKRAFYRLQGAEQMLELRRTVVDATELSTQVARKQNEAGNTTSLDLAGELGLYEQARLDLKRSERDVAEDREELTRLMGLWGSPGSWKIASHLPDLPRGDVRDDRLEEIAVAQRLDLASARARIHAALASRELASSFRFLPSADLGVAAEREVDDGVWSVGPSISLPIPLFDQGDAALAGQAFRVAQREDERDALEVAIRSAVRRARVRMRYAHDLAEHYRDVLLPLRLRVLEQTQLEYNAMLTGVFQLLTAKRDEIEAGRGYIAALRDYWIARTDLESALGSELPRAAPASSGPGRKPAQAAPAGAAPEAAPSHTHHHH